MSLDTFRITLNGFYVRSQTWDNVFDLDGKGDEVYVTYHARIFNKDKIEEQNSNLNSRSFIMGDTGATANVIRAGTLSWQGGLQSGDLFPTDQPWKKSRSDNLENRYPPMRLWEGRLPPGERVVFLAVAINEADIGFEPLLDLVSWTGQILAKIKDKFTSWFGPTAKTVFEGVELGLSILYSLDDQGILGKAITRPIGLQRDPVTGTKCDFTPKVIVLNYESATQAIADHPSGLEHGIIEVPYVDDPYYRGDYSLYLQVELVLTDGLVVKYRTDPKIYTIVGEGKLWIEDPLNWQDKYGGTVEIVPDGSLENIPNYPKDGTLIQEWGAPEVYVCQGGAKVWIPDPVELRKYHTHMNQGIIMKVPNGATSRIPDQPHPGVIFKERTSGRVVQFIGNGNVFDVTGNPYFPIWAFRHYVVPDGTLARIGV